MKKLYADDATKGVPADTVDKLRKMFAFLDDMDDPEEFAGAAIMESAYPNSRPQGHMEPERYGQSAVDFRIDTTEREIYDVNLEDYH